MCQSIYYETYETAIGPITAACKGEAVCKMDFGKSEVKDGTRQETPLLRRTADELREYLDGKRKEFDIPLAPEGTPFQQRVWSALLTIPYGQTRSYKDIALQAGSPKGFRAVGMANNKNPIAILIPCHRVIGADGSLTGYGGGMDIKERLLKLEQER